MKPVGFFLWLLLLGGICAVPEADASLSHRRPTATYTHTAPVTGYGANFHRRFVLKQELRKGTAGQRRGFRGNVRWYR